MTHRPAWRSVALARLSQETFDALVIGGGATGAAIARDAALRGLHVALCEGHDFAGRTSSQSSKLLHGGLRYLQYGDLALVFEGLTERRRLMATAPHLCRAVEFVFPTYLGQRPSRDTLGAGVALYDALGFWRPPMSSRRVSAGEIYQLAPFLRTAGLQGGAVYVDCQTDDARLVLENILDAEAAGAAVASYVRVRGPLPRRQGHLHVLTAEDRDSGESFTVAARTVVNATGPFSDALRGGTPVLRPTLGVHLVFDAGRLPTGGRAVVIHSPRDGRLIFTLPAGSSTIVGTTDTDWPAGPSSASRPPAPDDPIRARGADVDYLLEAVRHAFPAAALDQADVISTFAGLRPLIAARAVSVSSTSREHAIWLDHHDVLTVAGGKLTTMRRMAEEAVDRLVSLLRDRGLDRRLGRCVTRSQPLPGGGPAPSLDDHELGQDVRDRLLAAYGARAGQVAALAGTAPHLSRRLVPELPFLRAEVVFAVRHDHALEVEDVLRRRIPVFRDAPDQGLSVVDDAADLLAKELAWAPARRQRSIEDYRAAVASSRAWQNEPSAPR